MANVLTNVLVELLDDERDGRETVVAVMGNLVQAEPDQATLLLPYVSLALAYCEKLVRQAAVEALVKLVKAAPAHATHALTHVV